MRSLHVQEMETRNSEKLIHPNPHSCTQSEPPVWQVKSHACDVTLSRHPGEPFQLDPSLLYLWPLQPWTRDSHGGQIQGLSVCSAPRWTQNPQTQNEVLSSITSMCFTLSQLVDVSTDNIDFSFISSKELQERKRKKRKQLLAMWGIRETRKMWEVDLKKEKDRT